MARWVVCGDALAAVAATAGVMAQTATIYGIVDTGYEWQTEKEANVTTDKSAGLKSGTQSGSRIGFRGTEDLGGGLTAGFQIESGFTAGTGAGLDGFGRVSQLSLAGGFGTVAIGRNLLPTYGVVAAFDATGAAVNQTVSELQALNGNFGNPRGNGLWYSSSFGDINVATFYATGRNGVNDTTNKGSEFDLSVRYASGPLAIGVGVNRSKGQTAAVDAVIPQVANPTTDGVLGTAAVDAERGKVAGNVFGASYDLGMAKLFVSSISVKGTDSLTNLTAKVSETNFGVSIPVSQAATVMVAMGRDKATDDEGTKTKAKDFALGMSYTLSNRTNLFAFYSKNGDLVEAGAPKDSITSTTVGIRHTF